MAESAAAPLALEVKGLQVSFGVRSGQRHVVRGVDLAVNPGEVLGIVGESGSGKSTLALAIADLLPPTAKVDADVIRLGTRDVRSMPPSARRRILGRDIGFVFQDPSLSLDPTMTVGQQVGGPLNLHLGLTGAKLRERVIETMSLAGLPKPDELARRYPHQLSGGQRQRVMIAMAIACTPQLIIADEPTTALDVTVQAEILQLFSRLRNELGVAIIFVSHDLAVIGELADRVAVLYAGRVVELGTVRDVLDRPSHPYSAALVECAPWLGRGHGPLRVVEGSPPDPSREDIGCAFQPRCKFATAVCASTIPGNVLVGSQLSACHHALELAPTLARSVTARGGGNG